MVKIIGVVYKITTKIVTFRKLSYEQFMKASPPYNRYRSPEENIGFFYDGEMSLKYSNDVVDDLIGYAGKRFCELEIEKGVVTSIKPFKTESEILEEFKQKYSVEESMGKPDSLRDKLRIVLSALAEMEKETMTVQKSALVDRLRIKFDISNEEAERLIGQLRREGTIFEARKGYLKRT